MKKVALILAGSLLAISSSFAQTNWSVDKSHANIRFSIEHLVVSETEGIFRKFDGTLVQKNAADFVGSNVDFTIDVNSIDTDDEKRDGHLKSADFFDVAKYPTITFKSTAFTKVSGNAYKLTGNLTMHGVTKSVTLDVNYKGTAKDPYGNIHAGFKASTKIVRKDFGLTYNAALEAGGLALGETVDVNINLEFLKK